MRSSKSRSRSKNNRNRNTLGNVVNRVFDSSGPEGKVRGTPQQIIDKYNQLARDAALANDRVAAENFQQHAEHYLRMLAEAQREQDAKREQQERENRERQAQRDRERAEREAQQQTQSSDKPHEGSGGSDQRAPDHRSSDQRGGDDSFQVQDGSQQSGLVETPESGGGAGDKPRKPRRPRKKGGDGSEGQDSQPDTAETPAEDAPKPKPRRTRKPVARKSETDQQSEPAPADNSSSDAAE